VIYLARSLGGSGAGQGGCSTVSKYTTATDKAAGYANKAFAGLTGLRDATDYTAPHELLHLLLDAQHSDYQTEFDDPNMLWHDTNQNNTIDDTKRISPNQQTKIHSSPFAI